METLKEQLDLEVQFKRYCKMVNLDMDRVSEIQLTETRRAFYGGIGIMMLVFTGDVSQLEENAGVDALQSIIEQVEQFWEAAAASDKVR